MIPPVPPRRIMTDDGFNIGILYRGNRKPYEAHVSEAPIDAAELEAEFAL